MFFLSFNNQSVSTHASKTRQFNVFNDNELDSRKAKSAKLDVSNVDNTISPVPLPLKSTTSFHVPTSTTLPYRNQNVTIEIVF